MRKRLDISSWILKLNTAAVQECMPWTRHMSVFAYVCVCGARSRNSWVYVKKVENRVL